MSAVLAVRLKESRTWVPFPIVSGSPSMKYIEVDVAMGDRKEQRKFHRCEVSANFFFMDLRESSRHAVSSSFECVTKENTLSPASSSSTPSQEVY